MILNRIMFSVLIGIVALLSSATAQSYSEHPVVIRMQYLDYLFKIQDQTPEGKNNTSLFIREEIDRNTPSENTIQNEPFNRGEAMIALLKLLATLRDRFPLHLSIEGYPQLSNEEFWTLLSDAMKKLVLLREDDPGVEFQKYQGLAEYVLDWYTHVKILESLRKYDYPRSCELEWISYVYMVAIENSSHLKNSFSKGMLLNLNNIRNKANAIYIIECIRKANVTVHFVRFTYEWIIYDLELSNRNIFDLLIIDPYSKKILIEESLKSALSFRNPYRKAQDYTEAIAYSALLELHDHELLEYVNEIALAMNHDEVALRSKVISALHSMLKTRCEDPLFLNSGIYERLQDFEYLKQNTGVLFNNTLALTPKYLDFCVMKYRILSHRGRNPLQYIGRTIMEIFYNAGNTMFDLGIFSGYELLLELDKHHIAIYEADESYFHHKPRWLDIIELNKISERYTSAAKTLLKSWTTSPDELKKIRHKIRILLRLAIQIANLPENVRSQGRLAKLQYEKLALTYINTLKSGVDEFTTDSMIMKEWYRFTLNFPKIVSKVLDGKLIAEIVHCVDSTSLNSDANAVSYVFHARIANFLESQKRTLETFELFGKVLALEKRVGYADSASPFLQEQVLREKQLFYIFYPYQTIAYYSFDLKRLIEHHVELMTTMTFWHAGETIIDPAYGVRHYARLQLLITIYTAIANDPDADMQLITSGELLSTVKQLTQGFSREVGMNEELAAKVSECERISRNTIGLF